MQVHISPSMRSITISTSNGILDFMKIKVANRHLSYRTLFHTMLMLAFLLPFVFILAALVKLEGVNKCSSLDCLSRRLGPRLLGRADPSSRMAKDMYEVLLQANAEDPPEGLTVPGSFNELIADMKTNQFDAKTFAFKTKALKKKQGVTEITTNRQRGGRAAASGNGNPPRWGGLRGECVSL